MFKPMLATDKVAAEDLSFPVAVQPKLDGIRASVVYGRLLTRTLKEVPNREIFEALSRPEFEGLDGELLVGDPTADDAYRRTTSFCMAPSKTGEDWRYYIFDDVTDPALDFTSRYLNLCSRIDPTGADGWDRIVRVQTTAAPDHATLAAIEHGFVSMGYEGVIARNPSAPYKFGRAGKTQKELIKLKRFIDFEAEVVGVYEEMHNGNEALTNELGRTARSSHKENKIGKGTLGGLILRGINGDYKGVEFRCGTGFTAEMRADLWSYVAVPPPLQKEHGLIDETGELSGRGPLKGKTCKIKAFPVGVKDKPRHPVFLGWRDMAAGA